LTSPRPYVAAAAAAVLAAVFFVPSATASPGHDSTAKTTSTSTSTKTSNTLTVEHHATAKVVLADTGAIDTKPYVIGGASFLVAGAGLILNAGRRARQAL
jgi:hypothetical protein